MEVFPIMMDRRTAIKHLGGVASALLLTETLRAEGFPNGQIAAATPPPPPTGPFTLPPLPYAYDAIEPSFDATTMHLHHDKHHQAYRSEEHTSELQSLRHLVCRLLLEKKK